MIGFYNYTVILTYLGTLSGFIGITYMAKENLKAALLCLMVCGFCDMFDGKVASTLKRTKQEKRFGIQIDSLSDLICFGAFPAFIGWHCSGKTVLSTIVSCAYLLAALIRLAWFNVDEEERQDTEDSRRTYYLGLPVTTSGLLLPLFLGTASFFNLGIEILSLCLLLVIAAAFLTPVQLKKPDRTGTAVMALFGIAALTMVLIGVK